MATNLADILRGIRGQGNQSLMQLAGDAPGFRGTPQFASVNPPPPNFPGPQSPNRPGVPNFSYPTADVGGAITSGINNSIGMYSQLKQMQAAQDAKTNKEQLQFMEFVRTRTIANATPNVPAPRSKPQQDFQGRPISDSPSQPDQTPPPGMMAGAIESQQRTNQRLLANPGPIKVNRAALYKDIKGYLKAFQNGIDLDELPGGREIVEMMISTAETDWEEYTRQVSIMGELFIKKYPDRQALARGIHTGQLQQDLADAARGSIQEGFDKRRVARETAVKTRDRAAAASVIGGSQAPTSTVPQAQAQAPAGQTSAVGSQTSATPPVSSATPPVSVAPSVGGPGFDQFTPPGIQNEIVRLDGQIAAIQSRKQAMALSNPGVDLSNVDAHIDHLMKRRDDLQARLGGTFGPMHLDPASGLMGQRNALNRFKPVRENVANDPLGDALAKGRGERITAQEDAADSAAGILPNTIRLGEILTEADFESGILPDMILPLQGFAADLGIDLDDLSRKILGVPVGDLDKKQQFDRLTQELVIQSFEKFKGNLNREEVRIAQGAFTALSRGEISNIEAVAWLQAAAESAVERGRRASMVRTMADYQAYQKWSLSPERTRDMLARQKNLANVLKGARRRNDTFIHTPPPEDGIILRPSGASPGSPPVLFSKRPGEEGWPVYDVQRPDFSIGRRAFPPDFAPEYGQLRRPRKKR